MAYKVSTLVASFPASAANLTGVAALSATDKNTATVGVTFAQLRTALLGGGTGYTAADPITSGAISASSLLLSAQLEIAAAQEIFWTSSTRMSAATDGVLKLTNYAGTGFTTLQFGGSGTSHPALQRSGAVLNAVLADASAFTDIKVRDIISTDATYLHKTTTTLTDSAAAQVGTLTNAPAAGNPTKWISIDDNGTQRKIPAW